MRYLFINVTAGYGSTGKIVAETCRDLMAQGHECLIGYGRYEPCNDVPVLRIGSDLDMKLNAGMNRVLDNSGFGLQGATREFLRKVREYDPDVIWLHNVHGYYIHVGLLFAYLRTCGKKIFWTLHDCWALRATAPILTMRAATGGKPAAMTVRKKSSTLQAWCWIAADRTIFGKRLCLPESQMSISLSLLIGWKAG